MRSLWCVCSKPWVVLHDAECGSRCFLDDALAEQPRQPKRQGTHLGREQLPNDLQITTYAPSLDADDTLWQGVALPLAVDLLLELRYSCGAFDDVVIVGWYRVEGMSIESQSEL